MRARECVRACLRDVIAIYDNNILPRLIMIIKIIFLYFIEIAHTDDFPSTDTRLEHIICSPPSWLNPMSRHHHIVVSQTSNKYLIFVVSQTSNKYLIFLSSSNGILLCYGI